MQRNDSSSIISSLQMDYGDSDEDENDSRNNLTTEIKEEPFSFKREVKVEAAPLLNVKAEKIPTASLNTDPPINEEIEKMPKAGKKQKPEEASPVDFISDDEDEHHSDGKHHRHHHLHQSHHHHKHHHSEDTDIGELQLPKKEEIIAEAIAEDSPTSQGSLKRKATRLVSYGPDEDVEDEESEEEEEESMEEANTDSPVLNSSEASILSRSVQNMANDDIQIPPEPLGKCSASLQKKIVDMYEKMRRGGLDLNRAIQSKKNFRNPSIYEKLIDFCHINEKGTNFPPEIYDPHIWGKESFYDELDKAQRKDMERREKEKKERTKIEFMTGTKKPSSQSEGGPEEKKRKTKWDAQPGNIQVQYSKLPSANQNPGVANLTAMATGTKAAVISALGALSKKPSK